MRILSVPDKARPFVWVGFELQLKRKWTILMMKGDIMDGEPALDYSVHKQMIS